MRGRFKTCVASTVTALLGGGCGGPHWGGCPEPQPAVEAGPGTWSEKPLSSTYSPPDEEHRLVVSEDQTRVTETFKREGRTYEVVYEIVGRRTLREE